MIPLTEDCIMKFFFCETCGKRITEQDIHAGGGKDKKLKGVFCAQCAVGVLTLETLPINEDQARKILAESRPADRAAPLPHRTEEGRRSSGLRAGVERAGSRPNTK